MSVKVPDATMLEKLSAAVSTGSKPGMVRKVKGKIKAIAPKNCQSVNKYSCEVLASKHGTMAKPNHFFGSRALLGDQAEVCVTLDSIAKRGLYSVLLRKPSKSFIHKAKRGFEALRINGLLKQKCKKGSRKHYPNQFGKPYSGSKAPDLIGRGYMRSMWILDDSPICTDDLSQHV